MIIKTNEVSLHLQLNKSGDLIWLFEKAPLLLAYNNCKSNIIRIALKPKQYNVLTSFHLLSQM